MEGDQGVDVRKINFVEISLCAKAKGDIAISRIRVLTFVICGTEGDMKKRLLAVLTVFGLAVTLCACGNTGGNGDSSKASSLNAAEPTQTVAEQSGDEIADLLGKKLIPDEERDYYQKYFTERMIRCERIIFLTGRIPMETGVIQRIMKFSGSRRMMR